MSFSALRKDLLHFVAGSHYKHRVNLSWSNLIRALFCKEFMVILNYRLYHFTYSRGYKVLTFFLYQRAKYRFGVDIAPKAQIGPGLRIVHCSDIVIGPNVIMGSDNVIFNGITLGQRNPGSKDGMPKLGNSVTVGVGAKLLGSIVIGDRVRIGANAVVLRDVPAGTTAVGIPARIIQNDF